MSYHKFVEKCRNPHKGLRRDTSGRALNRSHRGCFSRKKYFEGVPYTERQRQIIDGTTDRPVAKREVVITISKAESLEEYEVAQNLYEMYGYMFHEVHEGDPTPEEAMKILDDLTPDDLK